MGALTGFTVIDCTSAVAGPMCTGELADHGARVVRVEPPDARDRPEPSAYAAWNRGKESVLLDLDAAPGRTAFELLLASADVLVTDWARELGQARGLAWDRVHARLPALVLCTISGFGDGSGEGGDIDEALVLARLGIMAEQAGVRPGGPHFLGAPMAAYGAAHLAVIGILGALFRRGVDGIGRHVETSLADGAVSQVTMHWQSAERGAPRTGASPNARLLNRSFRCSDGGYIGVHTAAVGGHGRLMELTGLADRIAPAKGPVEMAEPLTLAEGAIREAELHRIFATKTVAEWERALADADVCGIPLLPPGSVFDHPQAVHNDMAVRVEDPEFGAVTQVGIAAKLSATPGRVGRGRPRRGEHTDAVLSRLGMSASEIAGLRATRVIA